MLLLVDKTAFQGLHEETKRSQVSPLTCFDCLVNCVVLVCLCAKTIKTVLVGYAAAADTLVLIHVHVDTALCVLHAELGASQPS